jgi:hypothetical protein
MRHKIGWKLLGVSLLLALVSVVGCARAKPPVAGRQVAQQAVTTTPTEIPYSLRLRQAQGASPSEIADEAITVVVDNCASDRPLIQQHRAELMLQPECRLLEPPLPSILAEYEQALHDWVCATYGLAEARPASATVELPADAHARVSHALRWYQVYDRNVLEVRDAQAQLVAELPFEVHTDARLRLTGSTQEPCSGATETPGQAVRVPLVVAPQGDVTVATDSPGAEPTWAAGSDEALALVQAYIDALAAQDWAAAYALLHPDYQRQVPFARYVEGYAPVTQIELRGLDVTRVSETEERAEALLTITLLRQGEPTPADWGAVYEVVPLPGQEPYGRAIRAVRMQRLSR